MTVQTLNNVYLQVDKNLLPISINFKFTQQVKQWISLLNRRFRLTLCVLIKEITRDTITHSSLFRFDSLTDSAENEILKRLRV